MRLFVDAHAFDGGISQGVTTYIEGLYKELVKTASDIDFYFAAQIRCVWKVSSVRERMSIT